ARGSFCGSLPRARVAVSDRGGARHRLRARELLHPRGAAGRSVGARGGSVLLGSGARHADRRTGDLVASGWLDAGATALTSAAGARRPLQRAERVEQAAEDPAQQARVFGTERAVRLEAQL